MIQDHDDRFDFDESLFANDFIEPVYDDEEEEDQIDISIEQLLFDVQVLDSAVSFWFLMHLNANIMYWDEK